MNSAADIAPRKEYIVLSESAGSSVVRLTEEKSPQVGNLEPV